MSMRMPAAWVVDEYDVDEDAGSKDDRE